MKRSLAVLFLAMSASGWAQSPSRGPVSDAMWREFDLYRTRLLDLAKAIPADKYAWRPNADARSIGEVILHVSLNNYPLMEMLNRPAPASLYAGVPGTAGRERQLALFKKNVELEKAFPSKEKALEVSVQAFDATAALLTELKEAELSKPTKFVDRESTYAGIEMRIVAHLHEHLGQLIAYARSNGIAPPWSQGRER